MKRILGIETSCDECSLALVEGGKNVLAMVTYSQLKEHASYGGVVPELASRLHVKYIYSLYRMLASQLQCTLQELNKLIDAIAVTVCPGLTGSLMVGLHFAKGLALALNKAMLGIDHIQAHFYSAKLEHEIDYPYIGVVVSGGHSVIAVVHSYSEIEVKGTSLDDACGECFEKLARELDMGYPGGPAIDQLAVNGVTDAATFPRFPFIKYGYNFSYSGLKTAVLHHRDKYWNKKYKETKEHIAAAFQKAAIDMIVERIIALVHETKITQVAFGGGVSCNSYLKTECETLLEKKLISTLAIPSTIYCLDNAAMIAGLAFEYFSRNISDDFSLDVSARNTHYRATQVASN